MGEPLTLEEVGRRVGSLVWVEELLFAQLGAWVAETPDGDAKVVLATLSRHHGWRGDLLRGQLPDRHGVSADDLVAPPSGPVAAALGAVADARGPGATAARVAAVCRVVVPRVVVAYGDLQAHASPVADGALARVLRLATLDAVDDWREGHALLHRLLDGPERVAEAGNHAVRVERLLVEAGGLTGPTRAGGDGSPPDPGPSPSGRPLGDR